MRKLRKRQSALRMQPALIILVIATLIAAPFATADHGPVDRRVSQRMQSMHELGIAVEQLVDMTSPFTPHDKRRARQLQNTIERESRRTAKLFRKVRMDPHSRANIQIWMNWASFEQMADNSTRAAKNLNTRNPMSLAATLPPLLATCHDCHQRFRDPG